MSIRVIPEQRLRICDCCDVEMTAANSRSEGSLKLNRTVPARGGQPGSRHELDMDLCDRCLCVMRQAIHQAKSVRSSTKKG